MASEVVVGAALYKQDRLEIPVTTNVVSKEKIKQAPNPSLDKVIEDVPGVVMTRAGGQTTSTVQIRGSNTYQGGGIGTRVQGLYDGFPFNSPESGELVLPAVNMNAADKVEILKGAAATLYGSGAMGGVINVFGAMPDKMEVKAGVSGGFYDAPPSTDQSVYRNGYTPWLWNSYVGFGNKADKWNYNLLYTHSKDDGYRQNAQTLLNDVKFKAKYDIDAKQYLQLTSYYNQTSGGYAYSMPYDATISTQTFTPHPELANDVFVNARYFDYTNAYNYLYNSVYASVYATAYAAAGGAFNPFAATIANAAATGAATGAASGAAPAMSAFTKYDVYGDDTIGRKNSLVGLNYVNLLSDKLTLDTRLYYTYNSTRIEYNHTAANQTYATGKVRTPGEFNETDANRFGAGTKLDWRVADNHRLLFGIDANLVDVNSTQVAAAFPVKNQFNNIQEKNFAGFVQDEWKLTERLTALLSARYDWSGVNTNTVQQTVVTPAGAGFYSYTGGSYIPIKNSVDAVSPRIALNYKATDDTAFRASWGKSFRAPTLTERFIRDGGLFIGIPNPNLDKESMTAYELGAFKQFGDQLSVDVAGFINNYDNLIESIIDQTNSTYTYRNITKARIWGIETSLNYRPSSTWNFGAAYTYMNAKNLSYKLGENPTLDKNPTPDWLPMRPEHTASGSATWNTTSKLSVNLNTRYVGKYKAVNLYTNSLGSYYPGDFVLFNAGAKYQFTKNVTATLSCRNLTNRQYEEAEWFRAPGRSYVAGIDLVY